MSLFDFFYETYTSDVLLKYAKLCGKTSKLTRKDQRAEFIVANLSDETRLRQIWDEMDELSRKAVSDAYHNGGVFVADAFVSQYGSLPERPRRTRWSYYSEPILLDLFLHRGLIPPDLMPLLDNLALPPERFQLEGVVGVPLLMFADPELSLTHADTEEAGWHDLLLFLQLLDQGAIKLSSSSTQLTPASTRTLLGNLLEGDFLSDIGEKAKVVETIRPHGLTTFASGAGLISSQGTVTERGRAFLASQDPELLLEAVETWSEEGSFDELSRIDALKGMRSKGIRLTEPGSRRERIVEALSWCPTDVWINIEDFYRALKIWHFDFELEEGGLNKLYMGYRYGSHGYYEPWASHDDMWLLTNGLYINVVLWECLGSIGALDLLYLPPEETELAAMAYSFDGIYYSLYDGLFYFRINPLGAYLFGQAAEYKTRRPVDESFFRVTPDRQLMLLGGAAGKDKLTPMMAAQLDQIATAEKDGVYRLDEQRILLALEQGADFEALCAFVARHNQDSLPQEINDWMAQMYSNSRAFSITSKALLIHADSPDLAQRALADPELGKFSKSLDERTLVIPANRESRFRNRLREIGYGIA